MKKKRNEIRLYSTDDEINKLLNQAGQIPAKKNSLHFSYICALRAFVEASAFFGEEQEPQGGRGGQKANFFRSSGNFLRCT